MARYIDANAFQEKLAEVAREPDYRHEGEDWRCGVCLAGTHLDGFPTADVVPRSEVEKLEEYIDDLNDSKEHLCVMLEETRADVAREIFEEIKTCLEYEYMSYLKAYDYTLLTRIEELKKKYTEGE